MANAGAEEDDASYSDGSASEEYEKMMYGDREVLEYDDGQRAAPDPDDPSLSVPHERISLESFSAAVTQARDELAESQSRLDMSSAPDISRTTRSRACLPATSAPGFECIPGVTDGQREHTYNNVLPSSLLARPCSSNGVRVPESRAARLCKVEGRGETLTEQSLRDDNLSGEDEYVEPTTLPIWPPVELPAAQRLPSAAGTQTAAMAVLPLGRKGHWPVCRCATEVSVCHIKQFAVWPGYLPVTYSNSGRSGRFFGNSTGGRCRRCCCRVGADCDSL